MLTILAGLGLLALTLVLFSLFTLKMPKGQEAMTGMADAAVASFLVEAVHKYILGDMFGIAFFETVGITAGELAGVAAAIMVPLHMGVSPVIAVATGLACGGYGILPGFIGGYVAALIAPTLEKKLAEGLNVIVTALVVGPLARAIAMAVNPMVTAVLETIGGTVTAAVDLSPILMGFLLGGLMKVVCTAPLSSMALTAMLNLQGLPMGIAAIACVGGAFANAITVGRMKYGNRGNMIAILLEPLTQAKIVTTHPLQIYSGSFVGGGIAGVAAGVLNIVNNAPGTASPIPGLIAPFAFNAPLKVCLAIGIAIAGGVLGGFLTTTFWLALEKKKAAKEISE